jgi:hypothetical protein
MRRLDRVIVMGKVLGVIGRSYAIMLPISVQEAPMLRRATVSSAAALAFVAGIWERMVNAAKGAALGTGMNGNLQRVGDLYTTRLADRKPALDYRK